MNPPPLDWLCEEKKVKVYRDFGDDDSTAGSRIGATDRDWVTGGIESGDTGSWEPGVIYADGDIADEDEDDKDDLDDDDDLDEDDDDKDDDKDDKDDKDDDD